MKKIIITILMLVLCAAFVSALRNPSASYCTALGYEYLVENTAEGDLGLCKISESVTIDAWQFLQGESGVKYNYCTKEGYATRIVYDSELCAKFMTESCAVCILEDGKEKEVTELMGLSFAETECGDGSCGFPEDDKSCPQDCEGKMPVIPEMAEDSRMVDAGQAGVPNFYVVFIASAALVLACAGIWWLFFRKKKKGKKRK